MIPHQTADAANPDLINFQGKVVNANGTNVADGSYPFTFKLYSVSSGGSALWTETYSGANDITVTSGVFQVELGTLSALPDFGANSTLYLGITFNNDAAGEMTPRIHLDSVPYALNSDELGGLTATGFIQNSPTLQASSQFNISGNGQSSTSFTAPLLQSASSTALTITGNAASTWSTSAGNLSIQAASTNILSLDTGGAGTVSIGSNATTVTLGTGTAAETVNVGNSSGGNMINIGNSAGTNIVNIGSGATPVSGLNTYGNVLFKTPTNSPTAFQVQNTSSQDLFQVNTSNNAITLGGNNSGALNAWTSTTSAPNALTNVSSIVYNGYIYTLGGNQYCCGASGYVQYAPLNANGSVGTWATSTALPQNLYWQTAVVANGYVYVIGGTTNSTVQSAVYYAKLNGDGSVGSWQNATSLTSALAAPTSIVANGYIYVMGGSNSTSGNASSSTVYYAKLNSDGSLGSWNTETNSLPNSVAQATSVTANGYAYVLGGDNSSGSPVSTVYYAKLNSDGTTGTWSTNSSNPLLQTLGNRPGSVVANGYVYVLGGYNGTTQVSTVYYGQLNSNGSIGSWSTNTNALPNLTQGEGTVVANGYVYALEGQTTSSSILSSVYYASTQRIQVGGSLDLVGLAGGSLNNGDTQGDGSVGGSLTAGDGTFVGTLQVAGQASFAQGVGIAGNLSVGGSETIQTQTNSATAFQVQNAGGTSALNVDTTNQTLTVQAGTDAAVLGSELMTSSESFPATTGWTSISGTGSSATATHTTGTTALSPTPSLATTNGNLYQITYTITNPNAGSTLTVKLGGTTAASYSFDTNANTFTDTVLVTSSGGNLSFTPSTTFTGTVSGVSVKQITQNLHPALIVNNTSGVASIDVRASNDAASAFIGANAGESNVSGTQNTAIGADTLQKNISGNYNTAVGYTALQSNTTGSGGAALGDGALLYNTTGYDNTAVGAAALQSNTTGALNVAIGASALYGNTAGTQNVAIGSSALSSSANTGSYNTAVGYVALQSDTTGIDNTALGTYSLQVNTTGHDNTALGYNAFANNTTGYDNTAVGISALNANITGHNNTALGQGANVLVDGLQNATAIGTYSAVDESNALVLGCVSGTNSCTTSTEVGIDNTSPGYTLDVAGDINTTGVFRVSGTPGATTTCTGGQLLQNQVVAGGITTGGSCTSAGGSGVTTIGTLNGTSPSGNGAVISGATLYLQSASGSNAGLVDTATQTLAGAKTFSSLLTGSAGLTVTGAAINLNASSNFATNINTGSSNGAVSIGNSSAGAITLQSAAAINLTAGAASTISTSAGNLTLQANGTSTATLDTTGAGTVTVGTNATTINLGTGTANEAVNVGNSIGNDTVAIANNTGTNSVSIGTNSSATNTITIGSTHSTSNLLLQAGTGNLQIQTQGGTLGIGNNAVAQTLTIGNITGATAVTIQGGTGAINIGTQAVADTITLGNSTGASSVVINDGTGALNIGTNAIAHTITVGNSTGATSVVINDGTGALNVGTNAVAHTTTVGSVTGTATTTIQGGTGGVNLGTGGIANTIQIGTTTGAVAQTTNIGTNTTASSTSTVNIGSSIGTSPTTIKSGTSGITLNPAGGSSNTGVLVKPGSDTTAAFQVQNAAGTATLLNADTTHQTLTVQAGTDTGTATELFTSSESFPATTGWTAISGTGSSATATHSSSGGHTNALSPTPALGIVNGDFYQVTYTVTSPNSGATLGVTMGGQTVASYTFDGNAGTFTDSNAIHAIGTTNLAFAPSGNFTGTVSGVSVKLVTANTNPVLVVNNASGQDNLEVRASSSTTNIFIGQYAGEFNSTGTYNLALGQIALGSNTSGYNNTALGNYALADNTIGNANTAVGINALTVNTTGTDNTALGENALFSNTIGNQNVALGVASLENNTVGSQNTSTGSYALQSNTTGYQNTAQGNDSLVDNTTGDQNTAQGYAALEDNTTGSNNVGLGVAALVSNTTGSNNVAIGETAGYTNTSANANVSGSDDTFIGAGAGPGSTAQLQNATAIGTDSTVSESNALTLGCVNGTNGCTTSTLVGVDDSTPDATLSVETGGQNAVVNIYGVSSGTDYGVIQVSSQGSLTNPDDRTLELQPNGGDVQIGSSSSSGNSTTEFSVQNAAGTTLLNANTVNMRVSVGTIGTPIGQLYVSGQVPSSGGTAASTGSIPDGMYVQGSVAYVVNYNDSDIQSFDVSDPSNPIELDESSTTTHPTAVYVAGHYAYVVTAGGYLNIFDISDPADLSSSLASITLGGAVQDGGKTIYVQGHYAYVLDTGSSALQVIDVTNPANPTIVGTASTGNIPLGVYVQGSFAYVVNENDSTLQVFNVSNPTDPFNVATVATGNNPCGVYVQGDEAYVANQGGDDLQVFAVADPTSPFVIGTVSTASGAGPDNVVVQGRYAYVENEYTNTIQVFDVTDYSSVGTIPTGSNPASLVVQGRYAYVVNAGDNTVQAFDLGGAYTQQLEAGGIETSTLDVDANASVSGDASVQGSLTVGQNAQISGNLGLSGSLGGTVDSDSRASETSAHAYTETTAALGYYLYSDSNTTNTTFTTTFNITGLPPENGTVAFITAVSVKGATSGAHAHTTLVEIDGDTVATVATSSQTAAQTVSRSFTVMGMNSSWQIVGEGLTTAPGAGVSTVSTADYAEWIDYAGDTPPQPGDVLTVGSNPDSAQDSGSPYASDLLGVVSTTPYDVAGADDGHSVVLALTGRVPVNVSLENGPIQAGDPLTSSSTPGVAMKATGPGDIIGTALESYDGTEPTAQVMVQLHVGYDDPTASTGSNLQGSSGSTGNASIQGAETISGDLALAGNATIGQNLTVAGTTTTGTLTVTGTATLGSLSVSGSTSLSDLTVTGSATTASLHVTGNSQFDGDITIGGHVITAGGQPTVKVQSADGKPDPNNPNAKPAVATIAGNDTSGTISITTSDNPTAGDLADISFSKGYGATPLILISGQDSKSAASFMYPTNKTTSGFQLNMDSPPQANTTYTFDYFVTQ